MEMRLAPILLLTISIDQVQVPYYSIAKCVYVYLHILHSPAEIMQG